VGVVSEPICSRGVLIRKAQLAKNAADACGQVAVDGIGHGSRDGAVVQQLLQDPQAARRPSPRCNSRASSPIAVRLLGMLFIAQAFGDWLVGYLAEAARQRLSRWLLGGEQQRAVEDAATAAIDATARQLRPTPTTTDDPRGADHLARVIDMVFQQTPTPEESLAQQPTLLQGPAGRGGRAAGRPGRRGHHRDGTVLGRAAGA
jgi:hypothetical protein